MTVIVVSLPMSRSFRSSPRFCQPPSFGSPTAVRLSAPFGRLSCRLPLISSSAHVHSRHDRARSPTLLSLVPSHPSHPSHPSSFLAVFPLRHQSHLDVSLSRYQSAVLLLAPRPSAASIFVPLSLSLLFATLRTISTLLDYKFDLSLRDHLAVFPEARDEGLCAGCGRCGAAA